MVVVAALFDSWDVIVLRRRFSHKDRVAHALFPTGKLCLSNEGSCKKLWLWILLLSRTSVFDVGCRKFTKVPFLRHTNVSNRCSDKRMVMCRLCSALSLSCLLPIIN